MKECSVEGCSAQARKTGDVCLSHYKRAWARAKRGSKTERLAASDRERLGISALDYKTFLEHRERGHKRAGYHRNKDVYRERVRGRATGWTKAAREHAFKEQYGKCELCPRPLTDSRGTCGDHYETLDGVRCAPKLPGSTKHPRALLCRACNSGLGHYEDPNGQRAAGMRIAQYEGYREKFGG